MSQLRHIYRHNISTTHIKTHYNKAQTANGLRLEVNKKINSSVNLTSNFANKNTRNINLEALTLSRILNSIRIDHLTL